MSNGPGKTQRKVMAVLEDVRPASVSVTTMTKVLFGTDCPSESAYRTVRASVRSLARRDLVVVQRVGVSNTVALHDGYISPAERLRTQVEQIEAFNRAVGYRESWWPRA
jgi:hypothetical protein